MKIYLYQKALHSSNAIATQNKQKKKRKEVGIHLLQTIITIPSQLTKKIPYMNGERVPTTLSTHLTKDFIADKKFGKPTPLSG